MDDENKLSVGHVEKEDFGNTVRFMISILCTNRPHIEAPILQDHLHLIVHLCHTMLPYNSMKTMLGSPTKQQ